LAVKIQDLSNKATFAANIIAKMDRELEHLQNQTATNTESWRAHDERVARRNKKLQGINACEVNEMVEHFMRMRDKLIRNFENICGILNTLLLPLNRKIEDLERTCERELPDENLLAHVLAWIKNEGGIDIKESEGLFEVWGHIIEKKTSSLSWDKKQLHLFAGIMGIEQFLVTGPQLSSKEHSTHAKTEQLRGELAKKLLVRVKNPSLEAATRMMSSMTTRQMSLEERRNDCQRKWANETNEDRKSSHEAALEAVQDALDNFSTTVEEQNSKIAELKAQARADLETSHEVMFDAIPMLVGYMRTACSTSVLTCTGQIWEEQILQLVNIAGGHGKATIESLSKLQDTPERKKTPKPATWHNLMDESRQRWFQSETGVGRDVKRPSLADETTPNKKPKLNN